MIQPVLANVYLNLLDRTWESHCGQIGKIVRYADDFVLLSRTEADAKESHRRVRIIMERLGLDLHPEKTKTLCIARRAEGFEFLGWTVRKRRSTQRSPRLHFV